MWLTTGHSSFFFPPPITNRPVMLQPVRLVEFAAELTSGRQVELDVCNLTVLLDVTLFGLILENALSNAIKHGCPQVPRRLRGEDGPAGPAMTSPAPKCCRNVSWWRSCGGQ